MVGLGGYRLVDGREHEHADLDAAYEAFLAANTRYRVALRVHLEEEHGLVCGPGVDPQTMHRLQHPDRP